MHLRRTTPDRPGDRVRDDGWHGNQEGPAHMTTQRTIDRDELRGKLDRGDDFKLVMVLGEWGFRAKHIPGSLNLSSPDQVSEILDPDDEIVVY